MRDDSPKPNRLAKRAETMKRHSQMVCRVFQIKVQENKLSSRQKEAFERLFLEAKWFKNHILNWSSIEGNSLSKFNCNIRSVTKKDKDMNDVEVDLLHLRSAVRQAIHQQLIANTKTLSTLKKKGIQNPGRLKFSKEETCIPLKAHKTAYEIKGQNKVKLTGIPGLVRVNGMDQFFNSKGIEYANAKILKKASGYYIQITCYFPKTESKPKKQFENKIIGVDFGCSTSFTTSEGEKISVLIPESERLKRLQKGLSRKVKGSKSWIRNKTKIKKAYEKITNQKADLTNKLVHQLTTENETVVIQDEQLQKWHSNGHGKKVQQSILGRVKAKLKLKSNVVVLDRFIPTTKLCSNCGKIHDEMKLSDRTFKCECGCNEDRDVNAAKNMVWLFENNVGVGRTKVTRVEIESLISNVIRDQVRSMKPEDSTL